MAASTRGDSESPPLFGDDHIQDDDQDNNNDLFSSPSAKKKTGVANAQPIDKEDENYLFSDPSSDPHNGGHPADNGETTIKNRRQTPYSLEELGAIPKTTKTSITADITSSTDYTQSADELEDDASDRKESIEIQVSDPKKCGDGMNAYMMYKVTSRTNMRQFKSFEMSVTRRFSDFLGLHEKLVERHQIHGRIVPPPPEKSVVGATKVKMLKEDSGSSDFIEKRRAALERFLSRVAKHPDLRTDTFFVDFLESEGELPKATGTSTLSGAGIARLFAKVGDSIGKMTYTMSETDEWFEDKQEQVEALDRDFKEMHASIELLVLQRKDLAMSTGLFAKSVAILGSSEEHMALSRALSSLADIETKLDGLYADQADTDFFVFSELVKDYVNIIQVVKDVFHERVKTYKMWKDAEAMLMKKHEAKQKLEQQRKMDKLDQADQEIQEWEQKVAKYKDDFDEISKTIRREVGRFERQRVKDFRTTLINYLQCMMNNQQQVATYWESFLPEAKAIA